MAYRSARPVTDIDRSTSAPEAPGSLFKPDHPRPIDRYIDYFGGTTAVSDDADACGEVLLDHLA